MDASESRWLEIEYSNLRQEIVTLGAASQSAVRFFVPAAAAVYTVPHFLQQTSDIYIWTLCVAVAGILLLAMTSSLFASVDSIRRLGMYIKRGIEPRSAGGLRWEAVVADLDRMAWKWPSEEFVLAFCATLGNVAGAIGTGFVFLGWPSAIGPLAAASLFASLSAPYLWRMARAVSERQQYDACIVKTLRKICDPNPPNPPTKTGSPER
jgi:hypothetical protein